MTPTRREVPVQLAALARPFRTGAAAVVLAAAALACADPTSGPPPGALTVVVGAPAAANPGWALRDTLTVRAVDGEGRPRSGERIVWSVAEGAGTIVPVRDTTDSSGLAMAVWTLGARSGRQRATARDGGGDEVSFGTTAEAFRVEQLAASPNLACGLVGGAVWCWGDDAWTGTAPVSLFPDRGGPEARPAPGLVPGPADVTALAVSGGAVCAMNAAGVVRCANEVTPALTVVEGLPAMRKVVGATWGWRRFCALAAADSTAWCWQYRSDGVALVEQVPGSPAFVDLDADEYDAYNACGLRTDSTAVCWGQGPLGDGSTSSSATPVVVAGGHRFAGIEVGAGFACGLETGGALWCWGRNAAGQLGATGVEGLTPRLAATAVSRVRASMDLVLATTNGALVHWGGHASFAPTPVASLDPSALGGPVAHFANNSVECVRLADGQVYCVAELWDRWTGWDAYEYVPVPPVGR